MCPLTKQRSRGRAALGYVHSVAPWGLQRPQCFRLSSHILRGQLGPQGSSSRHRMAAAPPGFSSRTLWYTPEGRRCAFSSSFLPLTARKLYPAASHWPWLYHMIKPKESLQRDGTIVDYLWCNHLSIMNLLCIFYSFPFMSEIHRFFFVPNNLFNTEVCWVKIWKVSFTAFPSLTFLLRRKLCLFWCVLFLFPLCIYIHMDGHT